MFWRRPFRIACMLGGCCLFGVFGATAVRAQTQDAIGQKPEFPKWGSYFNLQTGWAVGSTSAGFLGEAAAGVRYRRWGLGLAAGVDNDLITSVPVMVDLRWDVLPGRRHTLTLFSQQGWNIVTEMDAAHTSMDYANGALWYVGVSYKLFSTSRTSGFWLTAGASYKQYGVHNGPPSPTCPGMGPSGMPADWESSYSTTHKEWRGVLTLGWGW
jgi:hypothetical protein